MLGEGRIVAAAARTWLRFGNGGGSGGVPRLAVEAAGRFRRVIRVTALLDSDRKIPRQRTGSHDKAEKLEKEGVSTHVLHRREADNYVPDAVLVLDQPRRSGNIVAQLRRLTRTSAPTST